MLTSCLVQAQEIRLDRLDDGPGLLPFKLGPTKLITHYHAFLQYVRLDNIESKVDLIKNQLLDFENRLEKNTYTLFELQINYLSTKLESVLSQLKSLEPIRAKRGLINGLGSIIKSITGNLDYLDAVKYSKAIETLEANQNNIVSEYNTHVSLSKEWMNEHSKILSQIVQNQQTINTTLQLILDHDVDKDNNLIKFAQFAQMLVIITENVDDLSNELNRIETSLALIRSSSTHHSMINMLVLKQMIGKLRSIYGNEQVLDVELREYFNIIQPASYYADKRIVIIFKIPIVSAVSYTLYKLSIAPNKHHQVLIPPYPLIAVAGDTFVYIEAECPKIDKQFLCMENTDRRIRTDSDCIQELISRQIMGKSCKPVQVDLLKEAMEQLDDRSYVLNFPRPTKVQLKCGRDDYDQLQGSYLATIPINCLLRTPEFTIVNDNDEIEGQPLKIMALQNFTDITTKAAAHLTLNSINLKKLHNIQDKITILPPLHAEAIQDVSLYHTTVPFYIVLLCVCTLATTLAIRYYYSKVKVDKSTREHQEDHEMPAIFSHKV